MESAVIVDDQPQAGEGDFEGAALLLEEALCINRKLLGQEHPLVATNLNNLGSLRHEKGDFDGAEALLKQALQMRAKLLGPAHPEVAVTTANIALVALDRGASGAGSARRGAGLVA